MRRSATQDRGPLAPYPVADSDARWYDTPSTCPIYRNVKPSSFIFRASADLAAAASFDAAFAFMPRSSAR